VTFIQFGSVAIISTVPWLVEHTNCSDPWSPSPYLWNLLPFNFHLCSLAIFTNFSGGISLWSFFTTCLIVTKSTRILIMPVMFFAVKHQIIFFVKGSFAHFRNIFFISFTNIMRSSAFDSQINHSFLFLFMIILSCFLFDFFFMILIMFSLICWTIFSVFFFPFSKICLPIFWTHFLYFITLDLFQ